MPQRRQETQNRRTFKYLLGWVVMGMASATGYIKGSHEIGDWFAVAFGLVTFFLAGVLLKMNLDDRDWLAGYYYELGFRHGQETRLIQSASGTRRAGGASEPPV